MIVGISGRQGAIVRGLRKFCCGRRGNISPLFALLLVPLIGAMSLATETSSWFLIRRAMQNTADSAVLAVAANGDTSACTSNCPTWSAEAKSVAANYGFTNGANNTTVTAINNATCPSPATGSNCYQVTITKTVPLYLSEVLGYAGTAGYGGRQLIQATAFARSPSGTDDCMLTLSSSGGFTLVGGPNFTANGCDLFSNWSADCSGHSGGFNESITVGTTNNCGTVQKTGAIQQSDPYQDLLANNPLTGCTTIISPTKGGTTLNPGGAACITIAGDLTIPTGTTTINTASPGTVLLIKGGGNIALTGTLTTPGVSYGLTIIFSGTSGSSAGFITGSGTLEFSAPTSGPWSGVSLYQDPLLTTQTSPTYSGSSPTFDITGLIYAPFANLTFKGGIVNDQRTGGLACLAFVAYTMSVNGSGSIFTNPTSQCAQAGLNGLPTVLTTRQALVQ